MELGLFFKKTLRRPWVQSEQQETDVQVMESDL